MRFCNKCGAIIIGSRCSNCFGMDLTTRSRLLNEELFVPRTNVNLNMKNRMPLDELISQSTDIRNLDFSKKISQSRLQTMKKDIKFPNIVKDMSDLTSLNKKSKKDFLIHQDSVMKNREEWINSVKKDVKIEDATNFEEEFADKEVVVNRDQSFKNKYPKHEI
ncbi:MAG: hypothetical protein ACTSVE_09185 [Candidatus Helarchaeota archaeon]